jgi:hypothetical protein
MSGCLWLLVFGLRFGVGNIAVSWFFGASPNPWGCGLFFLALLTIGGMFVLIIAALVIVFGGVIVFVLIVMFLVVGFVP